MIKTRKIKLQKYREELYDENPKLRWQKYPSFKHPLDHTPLPEYPLLLKPSQKLIILILFLEECFKTFMMHIIHL